MELHPSIEERATEDLLEIIENREAWRDDVILLAEAELVKRGVSLEVQQGRRKSVVKYRTKERSIKGQATYSTTQKIFIVLLGPLLVIIARDICLFDAGEGYKKKNRQGVIYLLLGILLWALAIMMLTT